MPENIFENMATPPERKDEEKENLPENKTRADLSREEETIQEDEESISYLGVKLEKAKAQDPQIVEPKERYEEYINYRYAVELQQKIAVSFKEGEPILLEGGTSLGKTTTVRKMASELGYEVHYINLNGQTDVENLMGRYISNPEKRGEHDPEYIFAEGEVTKGLRIEAEKKKIIILDEINAGHPAILKRLNEVIDSLGKDGDVTLTEDASERILTNKESTKIVGLMNPPGEGYEGVNPISKELIRRWNYQKEPSQLPEESFSYLRKARRGKLPKNEELPEEMFLYSNEGDLHIENLNEIPGYEEIEEQFEEFHKAAKKLLEERIIAEDQPQEFIFDDHEELRRFQQFVLRYYNGDINETARRALRFYYAGKLQYPKDKEKIEELINHISYTPPSDSRRREVEDEDKKETKTEKERSLEAFEEKALDYIEKLLKEGAGKDWVAQGLAGLDSEKAWEMRERLIKEGASKDWVAQGLAGLDSERAWETRERLLKEGSDKGWVAQGLAGLDSERAWEMRERLIKEGANKDLVAQGLAGDYTTFVWRYQ